MAFGYDFLDVYGRLLCYLNSSVDNFKSQKDQDEVKKFSYNEQQLRPAGNTIFYLAEYPAVSFGQSIFKGNVLPQNFWTLIKKLENFSTQENLLPMQGT